MAEKRKFLRVKDDLVASILAGEFPDGEAIPTEAKLAETHDVSRVTVRKALDALKADGVLTSTQGSGTRVSLRRAPLTGELDIVVVAASVYEPFFASFFGEFQRIADDHGTSVMFKQETARARMDEPAFYQSLLARGIRDFVLWPESGFRHAELLPRLRGVGANLVFFDHVVDESSVDCVALDNQGAVVSLIQRLAEHGHTDLRFVGWSDVALSASFVRETAFRRHAGGNREITRIARFDASVDVRDQLREVLAELEAGGKMPQAFVAISHDMGKALVELLAEREGPAPMVGVVDHLEPQAGVPVVCIEQPIADMAQRVFDCLRDQHGLLRRSRRSQRGHRAWMGRQHLLEGQLIDYLPQSAESSESPRSSRSRPA